MANGNTAPAERPPDFRLEVVEKLAGVLEPQTRRGITDWILELAAKIIGLLITIPLGVAVEALNLISRSVIEAKDNTDANFRRLIATAIQGTFGARVSPGDFGSPFEFGADPTANRRIGTAILEILSGSTGDAPAATDHPSPEGAAHYVGAVTKMAVHGWAVGALLEGLSAGQLEALAQLDDNLTKSLGLENITNTIAAPLLDATAVQPLEWWASKRYRHRLLKPGEAIEAFLKGRFTKEQLFEELARQGFSDERIWAWLEDSRKRLSFEDLVYLHYKGELSDGDVIDGAREHGIESYTASRMLDIAVQKRRDRWNDPVVDAAVAAYVARDLEDPEFQTLVNGAAPSLTEAAAIISAARERRRLKRHGLSAGEARRLARAEILAPVDYRRALEREGYDELAVAALDLELRAELQTERDLEAARREQEAERAEERERRARERAEREAELAARRARAFTSLADARRMFVRGYVPIDAYREALEAERLPNLRIAEYLADAEADRVEYLELLERKRQAEAEDADAVVPIAKIEESILRGILELDRYPAELRARGFDEDETRVLYNLLADRLEDVRQARAERDAAAARAELAGVSLQTFERAVRLGVRTRADYAGFLERTGTPAAARALILDLLDVQMQRDAEAEAKREAAEARAADHSISLEQRARAVIRGVRELEYYAAALRASDIPADDEVVLLVLVALEAEAAAEARRRRDELADRVDDDELSLGQVERAVRLGALQPADLRDRAIRKGLNAEDAELLVRLVVADLPDVRRAQDREAAIAGELATRARSLADEKAAVRRGIRTVEQYAAWLGDQGYGEDDTALLAQLLEEELGADVDGIRKRIGAKLEKAEGAPALADFEAALRAGELDVPAFRDALASWGVGRDEALVFGRLLLVTTF